MKNLRLLILFPGFVVSLLGAGPSRPELVSGLAPAYPAALANESVNQGSALAFCTIADDGSVLDVWVPQSHHPAFAAAAEEALATWRYAPAPAPAPSTDAAPAPWPRLDVVRFVFSRSGQITTRTHREALAGAFPGERSASFDFETMPLVAASRLTRTRGGAPSAAALPPGLPAGAVTVEFIVEASGRVRLPVALRAEHPAHARAAVAAVREWAFAPLAKELDAKAVRVRWNFKFPASGSGKKKPPQG